MQHKDLLSPANFLRFAGSTIKIYNISAESRPNLQKLQDGLYLMVKKQQQGPQDYNDDLSTLLRQILGLPLEIAYMIWKFLEPCAIRSLLIVESSSTLELLKHINLASPTLTEHSLDFLSFQLLTIKGERYLSNSK